MAKRAKEPLKLLLSLTFFFEAAQLPYRFRVKYYFPLQKVHKDWQHLKNINIFKKSRNILTLAKVDSLSFRYVQFHLAFKGFCALFVSCTHRLTFKRDFRPIVSVTRPPFLVAKTSKKHHGKKHLSLCVWGQPFLLRILFLPFGKMSGKRAWKATVGLKIRHEKLNKQKSGLSSDVRSPSIQGWCFQHHSFFSFLGYNL